MKRAVVFIALIAACLPSDQHAAYMQTHENVAYIRGNTTDTSVHHVFQPIAGSLTTKRAVFSQAYVS